MSSYIKNFKKIFIELSNILAYIDIIISFTIVSMENGYVKPLFNNNGIYDIKKGRHPVVEKLIGDQIFLMIYILIIKKDL